MFVSGTHSGVEGLAWAWSLAYSVAAVLAFVLLRRRIGAFGRHLAVGTTVPVSRMAAAALVMAVVVWVVAHIFPMSGTGAWAAVIVGSGTGLAVYWSLLELMHVGEIREIPRLLGRR